MALNFHQNRIARQRGFGMVVTLIVVAIIMILILLQLSDGNFGSSGKQQTAIDTQLDMLDEMNEQRFFTAPPQPGSEPNDNNANIPDSTEDTVVVEIDPDRPIQMQRPTPTPGPRHLPGMLNNIERTRTLKRELDTKTLNENLMMWKLSHPDVEVTIENLQNNGFSFPALRPGERYEIRNGNIDIVLY